MGMTMTQKILAAHAGLDSVVPGQLIEANIDLALANDITGPVAIRELKKADMDKVFDRTKVALVMDHFAPNKDIKSGGRGAHPGPEWCYMRFRAEMRPLMDAVIMS